jgi:DNA-binding MarR family transcriptional regulator
VPTDTTPVAAPPEGEELELLARIGNSWKELRRGAAMGALREFMFHDGEQLLEPGQWDTLDLLVRRDTWRMSELAEGLRVDPSTATRAVQRLLKSGLAERHSCIDDGRVVLVSATEIGRTRHANIVGHRTELMRAVVGAFDPDEQRQLAGFLERMVGSIDAFVVRMHDRP